MDADHAVEIIAINTVIQYAGQFESHADQAFEYTQCMGASNANYIEKLTHFVFHAKVMKQKLIDHVLSKLLSAWIMHHCVVPPKCQNKGTFTN